MSSERVTELVRQHCAGQNSWGRAPLKVFEGSSFLAKQQRLQNSSIALLVGQVTVSIYDYGWATNPYKHMHPQVDQIGLQFWIHPVILITSIHTFWSHRYGFLNPSTNPCHIDNCRDGSHVVLLVMELWLVIISAIFSNIVLSLEGSGITISRHIYNVPSRFIRIRCGHGSWTYDFRIVALRTVTGGSKWQF